MIFADASAILAVLLAEPDAPAFLRKFQAGIGKVHVSPIVRYEVVSALARHLSGTQPLDAVHLGRAERVYEAFLDQIKAQEVALDSDLGRRALDAARTYGKLVRHPAQLNMGDCFAHACARSLGATLLYKGEDFARTDLA